jgi:ACT domain-containing protein
MKKNTIVICALGLDQPGVVAKITALVSDLNGNLMDISQTIMQDLYALVMTVDLTRSECDFDVFKDQLEQLGEEIGSKILVQHQETFRYMHRV